jgi:hypothetical protein
MIKIIACIKRHPDLTLDEFRDYYEHRHAPLFQRTIPDEIAAVIVSYVQHHAVPLKSGSTDAPFDCITEIGFEDLAGMRRWSSWYLGPDGAVLRDDEARFMDTARRQVVVTEERQLGTEPPGTGAATV